MTSVTNQQGSCNPAFGCSHTAGNRIGTVLAIPRKSVLPSACNTHQLRGLYQIATGNDRMCARLAGMVGRTKQNRRR